MLYARGLGAARCWMLIHIYLSLAQGVQLRAPRKIHVAGRFDSEHNVRRGSARAHRESSIHIIGIYIYINIDGYITNGKTIWQQQTRVRLERATTIGLRADFSGRHTLLLGGSNVPRAQIYRAWSLLSGAYIYARMYNK